MSYLNPWCLEALEASTWINVGGGSLGAPAKWSFNSALPTSRPSSRARSAHARFAKRVVTPPKRVVTSFSIYYMKPGTTVLFYLYTISFLVSHQIMLILDLPVPDDVSFGSRQRLMDRGEFGGSWFMLPTHSDIIITVVPRSPIFLVPWGEASSIFKAIV